MAETEYFVVVDHDDDGAAYGPFTRETLAAFVRAELDEGWGDAEPGEALDVSSWTDDEAVAEYVEMSSCSIVPLYPPRAGITIPPSPPPASSERMS